MDFITSKFSTHPNGGAKIYDSAFIHSSVFAGPNVIARDHARILAGRFDGHVEAKDHARIFGGTFEGTEEFPTIVGIEAVVVDGYFYSSHICCADIFGGVFVRCGLFDQFSAWDTPRLTLIKATGGSRVYGSSELNGPFEIEGETRIPEGDWSRGPKHIDLGFCSLTEGVDGKVGIDCRFEPIEFWLNLSDEFGREKRGWTPAQCESVREALLLFKH